VTVPSGTAEIAASSLVSDGATQYVYVQEQPGKLVRRKVVTGPVREGRVVLMQGVAVGETVVEQGGILLDNQIELSH
jgi:membrane fusion protein, heavy metal efflux system